GPSKDYAILGTVAAGTELEFLGELKKDKRGVVWYKVRYAGKAAWVSSKYSKIV
ncbi:MAG: SH3 domain-containing protein, partial [Clostridia bacterium]|nr:SH3 domain-containing protein [Clostridia bacterium]